MAFRYLPILTSQAAPAQPAFRITLSANIAAGGEATTAYGMAAPAGKDGTSFFAGRRWDDENGQDSLTPTAGGWTKVGWCVQANSATVVNGEQYEFRVVLADGTPLNTYSQTPRWTIGTAAQQLPAGLRAEDARRDDAADYVARATGLAPIEEEQPATLRVAVDLTLTQSARFDDPDTFFGGQATLIVEQTARFDDADTFPSGQVNLELTQSTLYTDSDAFYSGQLDLGLLQASRYDDADTFYGGTVIEGTTLAQTSRFDDGDTFYGGRLDSGITQSARFDNADTFYGGSLSHTVSQDARFDDTDTFYNGSLHHTLAQNARFDNSSTFYDGSLSHTILQAARFDDTDTFYGGTVSQADTLIQTSRYDDADTFYAGTVTVDAAITQVGRFDSLQTFFGGSLLPDQIIIEPPLVGDAGGEPRKRTKHIKEEIDEAVEAVYELLHGPPLRDVVSGKVRVDIARFADILTPRRKVTPAPRRQDDDDDDLLLLA